MNYNEFELRLNKEASEMSILAPESKDVAKLLSEVLSSARYLVDAEGDKTDVVLSLATWEKILAWLEDVDDRAVIKEWLPRLRVGPEFSGTLRWDDVSADWEDDTTV
jgi:hypothetical protein